MSFMAISKVKYPKHMKEQLHSMGLKMLPLARKQPGLISVSFNQSVDSDETMMFWEWQSKSNHEACMCSDDWAQLMGESGEIFQAEGVEFSISTYESIGE